MEVAISKYFDIRKYIIVPNISWGFGIHEIDLFLMRPSGIVTEVEIKISVSDFKKDFTKRHNHVDKQNRVSEFYYALPLSILDKCLEFIPENAGIITCERYIDYKKESKIRTKLYREPKKIKGSRKLTIEEQLKIARLGCMRIWGAKSKIIGLQQKISEFKSDD